MTSSPTARDDLGPVEQAPRVDLAGAVRDVGIRHHVRQRPSGLEFAHDVAHERVLDGAGAAQAPEDSVIRHGVQRTRSCAEQSRRLACGTVHGDSDRASKHFAERTLSGLDDAGQLEEVRIWIDWLPGGIWGVGRAIDLRTRENPSIIREDEWVFRGYEMQDALEAANAALAADLDVTAELGETHLTVPFDEAELRPRLERWFLDQ